MTQPDRERQQRTRLAMAQAKLDALICRLPENILLLSGYWPMNGFAMLVFPREAEPVLLAPEAEAELASEGWVADVRTFSWGLVNSGDPFEALGQLTKQAVADLGLRGDRVGYEGSFEFVAAPYVSAEPSVISGTTLQILREAVGDTLMDATSLIHGLRLLKTPLEIERLRQTHAVARLGLEAFREHVIPGRSEIEIVAAVESAVMVGGTGHEGTKVARAWASIMSGPRAATAYKPHLLSTRRRLALGDMALLELAVVVDGWWADLTRTRVAGPARTEDQERWQAVVDAQAAALAVMRPGVTAQAVDRAARNLLTRRGLGAHFIHHTGHGLGLRYHEPEPFLHPSISTPLAAGMVTTVEPGIYMEGWGGMRCEDNVLVTPDGIEVLSEFSRELSG